MHVTSLHLPVTPCISLSRSPSPPSDLIDASISLADLSITPCGQVESLMCNYLTTPQMLVYSACVASCAIPGVFDPVELMAKDRDGCIVPYFR